MLLVEDLVRRMVQVRTADAMMASDAVEEKRRIMTLAAVLRRNEVVTFADVHAVETKLAFLAREHVGAVTGGNQPFRVVTVLNDAAIEDEIAVFARASPIDVVAVLADTRDEETSVGDCGEQRCKLFEKRLD